MSDMELLIAGCAVTAVFGMGVYVRVRQLFMAYTQSNQDSTRAEGGQRRASMRQVS